jgi:hypothetical protein
LDRKWQRYRLVLPGPRYLVLIRRLPLECHRRC